MVKSYQPPQNLQQVTDNGAITSNVITIPSATISPNRSLVMRPDLDITTIVGQGKPTQVKIGIFNGFSMPVYNNDNEELFFDLCVPFRYSEDADITTCIGAILSGGEDVGDKFNFQLSWEHQKIGEVIPVTTNDVEVETTVATDRNAQYDLYKVEFTINYDIDGIGSEIAAEDLLTFRLRRIAASANEVANEIIVAGLNIAFPVNKIFGA